MLILTSIISMQESKGVGFVQDTPSLVLVIKLSNYN